MSKKENLSIGVSAGVTNALSSEKDFSKVFLYSTIHDLKTPLNNIEGLLSILKKELDENNNSQYNPIIEKLEQCVALTKAKLVDFTESVKSNRVPYEDESILKFDELLDQVIRENENEIKANNIIVERSFNVSEIKYSFTALKSIMLNLITNAVKYRSNKRETKIKMLTNERDGRIILKVSDNGSGIDMKKNGNLLFKLYRRFHHHVEGTGLGLHLIKKIIEKKGGKIEVQSKINEGTVFEVTF